MADGKELIMVVDDETEARDFLRQILELEGYAVEVFANGAEALHYLNHSPEPCVIILDLRMPVMSGPQLRAALLTDPRFAAIPIVVVTALEPSAAAGLSAVKVFRKPVDLEALVGVVRQHC